MPTERKRRARRKTNGEYEVGYGKPPKEHQFQAGHSGNPAGGRKKARNFDSSRLGELVDKEASRKVVINGEEMTAEQALIRSMFLNGIRGKVTPQRMALKYREESEKAAKQAKADHIEKAVQYQIAMRQEIKRCRQAGLPDPEMPFHPDEIQINFYTGEIRYVTLFGPRDEPPPEASFP